MGRLQMITGSTLRLGRGLGGGGIGQIVSFVTH